MRYSITPARMLRLCLKELRESLRDRRTIVTLVLMPLLVYPLLSLVLNRILLTGNVAGAQSSIRLGLGAEVQTKEFSNILLLGYEMLQYEELAPVFLESVQADRSSEAEQLSGLDTIALPMPEVVELTGDGRNELRDNSIDLVIIRRQGEEASSPPEDAVEPEAVEPTSPELPSGLADRLKRFQQRNGLDGFDPTAMLRTVGRYDVRYRDGDPQSERALQLLERMLAAVNNRTSESLLGPGYRTPYRLDAQPVALKSNYAELLATLVPLVLVLMTMAGAVYPAIDLTAGERERGTMESLIVSPTPGPILLFAKYSAVVTVALLTALANLGAMTITLWVSGIGRMVFGDGALTAEVMGTVLLLLVLFTMFFAALLLAITSFAKSFKEAQAYLIPLMLLALTPGVMSL
ncbi:MAG: ABC transporter permease subunit, partial [Pirellulaceae bacterium]